MEVAIRWVEKVTYRSLIEVDEAAVREWLAHSGTPDVPITPDIVKEYIEAGDEAEWFEQCDTSVDFEGVEHRSLRDVISCD